MLEIETIEDRKQIENLGKRISAQELSQTILFLMKTSSMQWKFFPLLIHLQVGVFSHFLQNATHTELAFLQSNSLIEPLQHQLFLFSHFWENELKQLEENIQIEKRNIESLDEINLSTLKQTKNRLLALTQNYDSALKTISKALSIVWNCNRVDLIERLGKIKEKLQKDLLIEIGSSHNHLSGLFLLLGQKLYAVFGNPNNPADFEALNDTDPAIEIFPKFGVWFWEDFVDLGLFFPNEDLSQDDRAVEQTMLIKGSERLSQIGISTIKDLKEKQIFSKEMLKEYLSNFRRNPSS